MKVDTDNVNGDIDSAGAPCESAIISGQPGVSGNDLSKAETDFDLVVTKTVDNPTPLGPQRAVEFTVSIVNNGPGAAADVVVADQLPPELSIPGGMAAYTSAGYYDEDFGRWEVGDLDDSLPQVMTLPAIVKAESKAECIINTASTDVPNGIVPENNSSSVSVRSPDLRACVDLLIEDLKLHQHSISCEEDFWVRFYIRIVNPGPETAYNIVLNIEETLFIAPGLTIDHPNCDGMRCTWSALHQGDVQTVARESKRFNIDEPIDRGIAARLSSESGEYSSGNNSDKAKLKLIPLVRLTSCDAKPWPADASWNLSGVGVGGECFIATASYGSEWHPNVQTLREFRGNVLMKSAWGREVVEFYYRHSPEITWYISERESMRTVTRWLLTLIALAITYPWLAVVVLISLGILLYAVLMRLQEKPA